MAKTNIYIKLVIEVNSRLLGKHRNFKSYKLKNKINKSINFVVLWFPNVSFKFLSW